MVKNNQNPFKISKYENLKYRVLEIFDGLNKEEKIKFKEYVSESFYQITEVTIYNYMKLPIFNEDGTPDKTEIPFPVLYIISAIFGYKNPVDLMTKKYRDFYGTIYTMPKFDTTFRDSLIDKHNIHVPVKQTA